MSEKLHGSEETKLNSIDTTAETKKNLERLNKEALEAASHEAEVEELETIVESKSSASHEIAVEDREPQTVYIPGTHKELKDQAYKRSLSHVQAKLNPVDRTFSKVVHNPVIDAASEALSNSLARPSGILGGGIAAFIGSCILLYMSKHYGFSYNFFVFFALLGLGFGLGLIAEIVVMGFRNKRR